MATVIFKFESIIRSKHTGTIIFHATVSSVDDPNSRALILETNQSERIAKGISISEDSATVTIFHCGKLYTYRVLSHWTRKRINSGEILHSFRTNPIATKTC